MNREPFIWLWMLFTSESGQKTLVGVLFVFEIPKEKKIYGGALPKLKPREYIYKEERI